MIDGVRIYNLLSSLNITSYPIVADKGAKIPFAVYRRIGTETTKDLSQLQTYEVKFVGGSYKESLDQLNILLDSNQYYSFEDNGEEYIDNYFINTITIQI